VLSSRISAPEKSHSRHYRLSINDDRRKSAFQKVRVKKSKVVAVWLNGKPLEWSGSSLDLTLDQFNRSQNLLAIEVSVEMPAVYGQFVLSACLDAVRKLVSRRKMCWDRHNSKWIW